MTVMYHQLSQQDCIEVSNTSNKEDKPNNSKLQVLVSWAFSSLKDELEPPRANDRGFFTRKTSGEISFGDSVDSYDFDDDDSVESVESNDEAHDDNDNNPRKFRKQVSFSKCEIREYEIVVGDHPKCKKGLPLSLGWDHSQVEQVYSVEDFESIRCDSRRQRMHDMRLRASVRRDILRDISGYSDSYLNRMETKLNHERKLKKQQSESDLRSR